MSLRSPHCPARTHIEAMNRLLRLGTLALVSFAAVQGGKLIRASRLMPVGGHAIGVSLDMSPSGFRQTLDRRFAPRFDRHRG